MNAPLSDADGVLTARLFLSNLGPHSSFSWGRSSRDRSRTTSAANDEQIMKTQLSLMLVLTAAMNGHTASVERTIVAAMRLSEESSYSWHSSVFDDAQAYEIEGKVWNGYTWQRQPMPKTIAKRLGREAGHSLEAIFKDT